MWQGKYYFGAAHGVAGIISQLLLLEGLNEDEMQRTHEIIDWVSREAKCKSGNYRSGLGSGSCKLVQWCHGASGILIMLERANASGKYDTEISECKRVITGRGLLNKWTGFCHGLSGSARVLGDVALDGIGAERDH